MLSKKNRLSINGILKTEKTIASPLFVIKVIKNQEKKIRFAIIISKSVDKRAVHRNKLKRRLTEAINNGLEKIKPGLDFLIITKKQAMEKESDVLKKELLEKLGENNLLI